MTLKQASSCRGKARLFHLEWVAGSRTTLSPGRKYIWRQGVSDVRRIKRELVRGLCPAEELPQLSDGEGFCLRGEKRVMPKQNRTVGCPPSVS